MSKTRPLTVALHPVLAAAAPEVKYVLRVLLRLAGFPYRFTWSPSVGEGVDLYYGPPGEGPPARLRIAARPSWFAPAGTGEPRRLHEEDGLPFLEFDNVAHSVWRRTELGLACANDLVYASYWLLTGLAEPQYPRDARDNLNLAGSFFWQRGLANRPIVSLYGAFLREHFTRLGYQPAPLPWTTGSAQAALALTHDVDYPQIIRWIECLRLLGSRGPKGLPSVAGVLRGTSHFWKFAEWADFARRLGARPAFYFMARQGSLPEYALGTPDAFYDIQSPQFASLFRYLRDEGCEVGLHASYHAHRSEQQLRWERERLMAAAGLPIQGGRHHYWHLDPMASHETLRRHQAVGLRYDSSLGFEFYPGFRRGTCHPFRVYHPGLRQELSLIELPPAWMDDHFDRRRTWNGIVDCEGHARSLLDVARRTGGVVVLDYHVRGMNEDFYPRYGRWLADFAREHFDASFSYQAPWEIVAAYADYERALTAQSLDCTDAMATAGRLVATASHGGAN